MIYDTSGPYLLLRVHSSHTCMKGFSFAKMCHVSVYRKYIRTDSRRPKLTPAAVQDAKKLNSAAQLQTTRKRKVRIYFIEPSNKYRN